MPLLTLRTDRPGERADQFLARRVEGLTRSGAQKLLEEGRVTRDGRPVKKNERPEPGCELTVEIGRAHV